MMERARKRSTIVSETTEYNIPTISFKVAFGLIAICIVNCIVLPMYIAFLGFDYRFVVLVLNSLLIPLYLLACFRKRIKKAGSRILYFVVISACIMFLTYLWLYAFMYV